MRIGLLFLQWDLPVPDGMPFGAALSGWARRGERSGVDSIFVADHFLRPDLVGGPDGPMLESVTTLGYLAAVTERAQLGMLVGGIHHRHAAVYIKAAATLDVLSGGRACLGLGAGWHKDECLAIGMPFPSTPERYAALEGALATADAMWPIRSRTGSPPDPATLDVARLLDNPKTPFGHRPMIIVGGNGPRRTMPLVARYADGANVTGSDDEIAQALAALDAACGDAGRPVDDIERSTVRRPVNLFDGVSASPSSVLDTLSSLHEMGIGHVMFGVPWVDTDRWIDYMGEHVVPFAHALPVPARRP
jgi:alkanesulfonate monooxygenase SsuD/methylene tetrahydromethanopterin reductase-like flavin-dependent oxidoreductase (luciferase family)